MIRVAAMDIETRHLTMTHDQSIKKNLIIFRVNRTAIFQSRRGPVGID